MIAYLSKFDASEGFNQIIDFLNGSSIKYALTVNPNIYVSCIKQFWTTVAVKKVNDVPRLQALVDKKKVVVTEATIRDALYLDDAEGVECLPNEEIFAELARICYQKPSTKLTFYKAFFSSQWKFLIHTILQCMSDKRTSWNEFSSSMASAIICLSTGRKFNFSKYIFDSLVWNVDSPSKFYMYPRFLQLIIRKHVGDLSIHTIKYTSPALTQKVFANIRRVGKGFFEVETPLFKGMIVEQQVAEGDSDEVHGDDVNAAGVAIEGVVSAADDVVPTADEEQSITSPLPPTPPLQPSHDILSNSQVQPTPPQSPQAEKQQKPSQDAGISMDLLHTLLDTCTTLTRRGRMIAEMDTDANFVLEDKDVATNVVQDVKDAEKDESEPAEVQEVVDVVTTAKIISEVVNAASDTITAASTNFAAVEAQVPAATTIAAPLRLTVAPRRRKGVVIRDPEESTTSTIIPAKTKSKDKGKGILVEEPKPLKKQAQIANDEAFARELEVELNRNTDWDEILDHVQKKAKEDPAVKRYQALKRKPQTEAQARKNMIVYLKNVDGFKMYYFNGMSYDDIRPIFEAKFNTNVAFLQKTKEQIEEEDSRALKRINETPTEKASKRSVHGQEKVKSWKLLESCGVRIITLTTTQLILLVERKYPLTKFTLNQMLNNVRLEVEEESEVSLELLRKKLHKAAKRNQGKGKAKMGYAPVQAPPFALEPKNPPTPKKDNLAKDVICHQCGCGTHICITTQGLRGSKKLKPVALSLYVGDGHRATVKAIGEYHLDDIYEIVMSSSNANDSYVYVVSNKIAKLNLDSALLWHCRLGHINKKRIKKLQHGGLLDSTDIRSTRTCLTPDRMCLYIDAKEHDLGDLDEPANYQAALLNPKSDKWLNAMNMDMQSMKDNEVWELVDLPPNAKTVGHKWLFKKKTDIDGAVHTYKARLMSKLPSSMDILIKRYVMRCTRPDGVSAQNITSRFQHNLGDAHWTTVKNILKYLRNTKDMFLIYGGYVFNLNGGAVDWKSTKQSIFATSSTDAKSIAAFDASKEAVWIRKFIYGLGVVPTIEEPINMYCGKLEPQQ
nr:hypothetical protein [Tanacetum cinerariifolium]